MITFQNTSKNWNSFLEIASFFPVNFHQIMLNDFGYLLEKP